MQEGIPFADSLWKDLSGILIHISQALKCMEKSFNHWRNFFLENYKIGNDTWRMYFHWIVLCWVDPSARHDSLNSYIMFIYFSSLFSILPSTLSQKMNKFFFFKTDYWNKLNLLNLPKVRDPSHTWEVKKLSS